MDTEKNGDQCPQGYQYIFVTSFFHKGLKRRIYARECGKRCFRLMVPIR